MQIQKLTKDKFKVIISADTETSHEVTLEDQYWIQLTDQKITKEDLIKLSFEFLLEKESNQTILSSFDLKQISDYFPEFEIKIKETF